MNKQSQNTKQVGVLRNIWDEEFLAGSVWKIFKSRKIIRTHCEAGRNEPKWGDLFVGWIQTGWFQPQFKVIYCYKKMCAIFFCGLIDSFYLNLFLCSSNILSFSTLSLFLVVSEIKCKYGNSKRLRPRWNFPRNNTLLSIITLYRETDNYENFHLTNIFEWVNVYEKIPYRWNNTKPSKKRKY